MSNKLNNKITNSEFKRIMQTLHPTVITDIDYTNTRTTIELECKYHGIFKSGTNRLLAGNGCRVCLRVLGKRVKLSLSEYIMYANIVHSNKYDYTKITNFKAEKINVICPIHGEFLTRKSAHIAEKQSYSCPKCSRGYSKFEIYIEKWLTKNHISYEIQKKFDGLCGKRNQPLSYDFYLPDYNLLIEFDGPHHFQPMKFNKAQTEESKIEKFESTKTNDGLKIMYAFSNNINLMHIGYQKFSLIDDILAYEILKIGNVINDGPVITTCTTSTTILTGYF